MAAAHKDLKILVVEDNSGDFVLIEEYLFEALVNPDIKQVKTYSEAKEALLSNNGFNAILLDLTLPDLSGENLVQKMIEISGQVPIIVLTGYENRDFGLKTLSMGVADYLLKDEMSPFVFDRVIAYSMERSRINKSVKKSEKKYRDIFNLSPLPMWIFDIDTLEFIDVNHAAILHYGYSQDEFLSMTILDIRQKEDIEAVKKAVNSVRKDPFYSYQHKKSFKHLKKNGEVIDVDIKTSKLEEDRNLAMVVAEDVTEKLTSKRAIAKKSKLLAASAQVSGALIKSEDWFNVLEENLDVVGKAVGADRVYLFQNLVDTDTNKEILQQKLEWSDGHIESQIDNPDLQYIEHAHFPDIMDQILNKEVYQAIIKELEDSPLKELFMAQNIQSILILPIFIGNQFYGFIGFDDCSEKRKWEDQEIQYLKTIASNISSAIQLRKIIKEQELSERRFRSLVQDGADLLAILDSDANYKYVAPSSEKILNIKAEDFIGKNAISFIHPEDQQEVVTVLGTLETEEQTEVGPFRFTDGEGNWRWIESIITNMLQNPAVQGFVANSRDVTETIKREKELRESLERYDIVNKATSDTIWDLNIQTEQMIYNSNIYSMFGYEEKEIRNIGTWWKNKIHPEDLDAVEKALAEVLKNGKERFQMQYRFKTADGSYKHVLDRAFVLKGEDGAPTRIIGAMQDVTHEVEEAEQLKLLESVVTNTKESVVITEAEPTDLPGRKIIFVNDAFTNLFGYDKEYATGKTLHFLNGPKTDPEERLKLREAMNKYEPAEAEFINYTKSGDEIWINISMVPVADSQGKYTHWISIGRDVTEEREYQENIKSSLQEKETLLAEIHHRVKNNLAVVSGMMQLQAFGSDNAELQAQLLDSVARIKTMASVHELLYQSNSFSRLEFSETLKKLVENVSNTYLTDKDITLDIQCEPVTLNINLAIPAALIVNEVLTNTYKHAFKDKKDGKIIFKLNEQDGRIYIEIADNGVGIPQKNKEKKESSLGMHLIEVLSDQLEGVKEYISKGKGTTFTLNFPKKEKKGGIGNTSMS